MFLQLLQRNADYYPEGTAIEYGDLSLSHAALLDRVERCARGLGALGIKPGDRVALLLENSPDYIMSFFAVAACRAVNVPLNLEFKVEEVQFFLSDARVSCIIVDEQRADLVARAVANVAHHVDVLVRGEAPVGATALEAVLDNGLQTALPNASLDDDIIYIYSSGTTGRPKCAPRTVVQYWWEMDDVIECLKLTRDDTIFGVLPLFHNFGSVQCMLAAAGSGARLVMLPNPNPFALRRSEALKLLERERVSILPGVPFMFEHLVASSTSADLSSVRICYSAAAALSQETAVAFYDKFGVPIRDHYGCTEVGAMTINMDADPRAYSQSVGQAFPGVRIRILDDDGREMPTGETGEIVVGSRAMTRGYLGMDEDNREIFRNSSFYTGDLGRLDAEGRLYLLGRKKFVIDVVGHKVSPIEVEDVLAEHPQVRDSVVLGVPNPQGSGQAVAAYVVLENFCSEDELISFCRDRLANFKVPQSVEFISQVPRNALGKIVRQREAIERFAAKDIEEERVGETI
jgi:long-chain acyl-CoA synthetase